MELLPLLEEKELKKFKVEYATKVIEQLEQLVEDSPAGDGKIVFTGHRGCGKSTLLLEEDLATSLNNLAELYYSQERYSKAEPSGFEFT